MSVPEDVKSIFEVKPKPPQKTSFWKNQAKYFVHGVLWWLFSVLGLLIFPLLMAFLVMIGLIIGAIIGLIILFLFIGFVNWMLSERLWFPMKEMTFSGVLGHGLFFAIALVIVNGLTVMLPVYISRNNIYVILVTLVWGCYIDGHIGKTVAKSWREPREEKQFESSYE